MFISVEDLIFLFIATLAAFVWIVGLLLGAARRLWRKGVEHGVTYGVNEELRRREEMNIRARREAAERWEREEAEWPREVG